MEEYFTRPDYFFPRLTFGLMLIYDQNIDFVIVLLYGFFRIIAGPLSKKK